MMLTPQWLVEALIGATLLMLLVLAVRKPVARLWGAHMAYALWALPALRMVLPAFRAGSRFMSQWRRPTREAMWRWR